MWHIQPKKSTNFNSNAIDFLYQDKDLYIMDNHSLAAWCWSQIINFNETYDLLHIDQHYDLIHNKSCINNIDNSKRNLEKIKLNQYLNFECEMMNGAKRQLFRFDSYINNFAIFHPKVISNGVFITQGIDTKNDEFIRIADHDYNNVVFTNIDNELGDKIIINIDIDYFFSMNFLIEDDEKNDVTYSQLNEICELIKRIKKRVVVITIALTPNFCGGLNNSIEVLNEILPNIGYSKFEYH